MLFAGLKHDHKAIRERVSAHFCSHCADLDFQAQNRAECHLQLSNYSNTLYGTGNNKYFGENFDFMKHFVQSCSDLWVAILPSLL